MKNRYWILSSLFLAYACSVEQGPAAPVSVGASAASVNPEAGAFIAGDKPNRRFSGIHDSLFVKALVVTDGKEAFALVTVDCIGLLYPAVLEIRAAVAERIPPSELPSEHLVVSSTHTHSGPDVVGIWGPDQATSGVDPAYMDRLVQTAARQVEAAWKNRRPATLRWAETQHGEEWVYNISEPLEVDRTLSVLQFSGPQGESIATLTNFACHPTFMDAASDQVSADYPGGLYRGLDEALGGINLFLQGAIGGWVQPEGQAKTFENAEGRGRGLAEAVLVALAGAEAMPAPDLEFRSKVFQLPLSNEGFQQLAAIGVIQRALTDSVQTEVAWFRIGNAYFATHPGETPPAYSIATRRLMPAGGPKFVIGLGLDGLGYILKPEFFDPERNIPHAGYLTGMSPGPGAGPAVLAALQELAGKPGAE